MASASPKQKVKMQLLLACNSCPLNFHLTTISASKNRFLGRRQLCFHSVSSACDTSPQRRRFDSLAISTQRSFTIQAQTQCLYIKKCLFWRLCLWCFVSLVWKMKTPQRIWSRSCLGRLVLWQREGHYCQLCFCIHFSTLLLCDRWDSHSRVYRMLC